MVYLTASVDKKCHTLLRQNCPRLNAADKNTYNSLYSKAIAAKYSHMLVDAPTCVKNILYPNTSGPTPPPVTGKTCAKVKCSTITGCGIYSVNATTNSRTFDGKLCGASEYCPVTTAIFNATTGANFACKANPTTPIQNRYPGEKCDNNNLCAYNQTCTSGLCTGKASGEACIADTECKVGLYCNTTTCVPQVKAGSNCTTDFMCPNTQGCLNGNCTDYYSVALGVKVPSASFCKSRQVNEGGLCYGLKYNGMTANKDGLVKCDINATSPCNYTDSLNVTVTEDCQCSFDKDGQSFCRKAYDEGNKDWIKHSNTLRAKMASTQCHTNNRMSCWDVPKQVKTDAYDSSLVTSKAHEFFYADDCIKKLFNAGEFVKLSFVVLVALFALF
jgi:hypothetical protein